MSFTFATPVRLSDVDHAGIVYFPRFFHMFHLAFEEPWRTRLRPRAYAVVDLARFVAVTVPERVVAILGDLVETAPAPTR